MEEEKYDYEGEGLKIKIEGSMIKIKINSTFKRTL